MKNKITFSAIAGYMLMFVTLLFSSGVSAQTTMLSDDFSNITTGNSTENTGSPNPWTGDANFPEAGLIRAFQAGGAVRIGTGSLSGYITTIPLNLGQNGGNFTVMFDVKGWTTVEGGIKVTLTTPSGSSEQIVTYTATMANTFETKTLVFTGGMANSTIRIETTAKRAFIDNVMITINCPDITEPTVEAQAFCGSATVADLEPSGAGINWYSTAGTTPLNSTDVIATGTYFVSQTTGTCESDLVPVSVTVNSIPDAPNVTPLTFCNEATVAELSANGTGLQWYTSAAGGNALALTQEIATATYYVSQIVNGCESERTPVQVTVNNVAPPEATPQGFCNAGIVDELFAEGTGVLWYTSAEGGVPLNTSESITEGTYYASQTINGCESERVSVLVNIIEVDTPQGAASQQFSAGQTLQDLAVTSDSNLTWYSDADLTTEIPVSTSLTDGTTYYVVASEGLCVSEPLAITVEEVLGNESFNMAGLIYYPNPADNVLSVVYNEPISSIAFYTLLGQKVLSATVNSTSSQIDISGLSSGSYLLKIASGDESKTIRIMKK